MPQTLRHLTAAALCALSITTVWAQGHEATIRKNLSERIPQIPKIEEITRTPLAGARGGRLKGEARVSEII